VTFVLKTLRRNKTLNFWRLRVRFLSLTLWLNLTANDELPNLYDRTAVLALVARSHSAPLSRTGDENIQTYIIVLGEAEELSDLRGTLRTEALWVHGIR
jgi:hypothetical protein